MEGGRGGREWDRRAGGERDDVEVEDEENGSRRFLREKDCSAWEKWAGSGRGVVAILVSVNTDMMWPCEGKY